MKYEADYFEPNQDNNDRQYYVYVEGDKMRKVCLLLGEFNTEHAANTIAHKLSN